MESNSSSRARRILTFLLFSTLLCIILITNDAKIVLEGKLRGTSIQISVVEEEDIIAEQAGSYKDAITTAQNKYHFHGDSEQVVDVDKSNEYDNDSKQEDTETNVHRLSCMYSSPRIIVSHACSGSSATVKFAEKIFNAHGLKEKKILLYKANLIKEDIVETLKDLEAALTITYRKNTLDKAICVIRDCFQKAPDASFGHQVYSNGTKADLCFSRRNSKVLIKAMITNKDRLVKYLKSTGKKHQVSLDKYSFFINSIDDTVAYEDLFAFEYTDSEETFEKSVDNWMTFLRPFRLNLDRDIVLNTLERYRNSRNATVHSEVVYNMDVLHTALDGTPYEVFVRG
ncbi:predicted protein [Chaetoceros tenuissimus]|uniref:Uncharacterized protein n=1 Tax=Chaetoceros tenuissimus TaxID=426638 RepID=A0AAD3H9J9_9STRA|nr:predicted protein [Chaetoceros tenuissimus]